jgi:hypothetical protein
MTTTPFSSTALPIDRPAADVVIAAPLAGPIFRDATPKGVGAVTDSGWLNVAAYGGGVVLKILADQASGLGGITVDWSEDGGTTIWASEAPATLVAATKYDSGVLPLKGAWVRAQLVNGGVAQTSLLFSLDGIAGGGGGGGGGASATAANQVLELAAIKALPGGTILASSNVLLAAGGVYCSPLLDLSGSAGISVEATSDVPSDANGVSVWFVAPLATLSGPAATLGAGAVGDTVALAGGFGNHFQLQLPLLSAIQTPEGGLGLVVAVLNNISAQVLLLSVTAGGAVSLYRQKVESITVGLIVGAASPHFARITAAVRPNTMAFAGYFNAHGGGALAQGAFTFDVHGTSYGLTDATWNDSGQVSGAPSVTATLAGVAPGAPFPATAPAMLPCEDDATKAQPLPLRAAGDLPPTAGSVPVLPAINAGGDLAPLLTGPNGELKAGLWAVITAALRAITGTDLNAAVGYAGHLGEDTFDYGANVLLAAMAPLLAGVPTNPTLQDLGGGVIAYPTASHAVGADVVAPGAAFPATAQVVQSLRTPAGNAQTPFGYDDSALSGGGWSEAVADLGARVSLATLVNRQTICAPGVDSSGNTTGKPGAAVSLAADATPYLVNVGTYAFGQMTFPGIGSLANNDHFTISDGVNTPTVFDLEVVTAGYVNPGGRTTIDIHTLTTGTQIAAAVVSAINGIGATLAVTASATTPAGATIQITNNSMLAAGNVAITATTATPGVIAVVGMSGGHNNALLGGDAIHINVTKGDAAQDGTFWAAYTLVKHGDPVPTAGDDMVYAGSSAYVCPWGTSALSYDLYAFRGYTGKSGMYASVAYIQKA